MNIQILTILAVSCAFTLTSISHAHNHGLSTLTLTGVQNNSALTSSNHQDEQIQHVVNYTNQLRAEKGLAPLSYDENLSAYAQVRANELGKLFSHTRPNGKNALVYVQGRTKGENIAAGGRTAKETVMKQWRNSKGHYRNMMGADYRKIGVGMVYIPKSKYGYYWVQIFGSDDVSSSF